MTPSIGWPMKLVSLADRPWELCDMSKDREEMHDLAASMPDRVKSTAAIWDACAQRCHVYPKPNGGRAKKAQPGPGESQLGD